MDKNRGKMKIAMLEDWVFPEAGYEINTLARYLIDDGWEVHIITSDLSKAPEYLTSFFGKEDLAKRDRLYEQNVGVHTHRVKMKGCYSDRSFCDREMWDILEKLDPDIVFAHGNDTLIGIQAILRHRRYRGRLLTDSHMTDVASHNRFRNLFYLFYRVFITPIILRNKIPILRHIDDPFIERRLGIPLDYSVLIGFGTDTILFQPNADVRNQMRREYDIPEHALVYLYAGKLDEFKGGMLLAHAIEKKIDPERETVFVIIGNTNGDYGKQVEDTFARSENRIIRLATQKHADLAQFYQMADVALYPREGSLSYYDAQACGLPAIIDDEEMNRGRCDDHNGMYFRFEDAEDLRHRIRQFARMEPEELAGMKEACVEHIHAQYDFQTQYEKYKKLFYRMMEGK